MRVKPETAQLQDDITLSVSKNIMVINCHKQSKVKLTNLEPTNYSTYMYRTYFNLLTFKLDEE